MNRKDISSSCEKRTLRMTWKIQTLIFNGDAIRISKDGVLLDGQQSDWTSYNKLNKQFQLYLLGGLKKKQWIPLIVEERESTQIGFL